MRLGEWDYNTEEDCPANQGCNDKPVDVDVEEAIAHDQYLLRGNQNGNRHHDIALLRLSRPVAFTGKSSIKIIIVIDKLDDFIFIYSFFQNSSHQFVFLHKEKEHH